MPPLIPTAIYALAALIGAIDPHITQDNIAATICRPGYARSVRQPASWSRAQRKALHAQPGQVVDHIVPIEIGGAPADQANLQLQDRATAKAKDRDENRVRKEICRGDITLEQGQALFRRPAF